MNNDEKTFITLSASAINRTKPGIDVADINLGSLYELASSHQMISLIAEALESVGIKDSNFRQEKAKAIRKTLILDYDRSSVITALEEAKIWHMSLKGVILKDYYPQVGMRQMSDNDILFDAVRADDVKTIMENLGFSTVHFGIGHQDDYQKSPVSHFEMHRMLFAPTSDDRFYKYYQTVKDRLEKDENNEYGYHFTNEDFYIYMIAHEYKHYSWGGTGIRSLLDTYAFLQKFRDSLDWEYINQECMKLGIEDFEEKNRKLAFAVFSTGNTWMLSENQEEMLAYFLRSGTYGTKENIILNGVKRKGRLKYIWSRIFPPMGAVKEHYPFFYKHKILFPFLPIYRMIKGWDSAKREISIVISHVTDAKTEKNMSR